MDRFSRRRERRGRGTAGQSTARPTGPDGSDCAHGIVERPATSFRSGRNPIGRADDRDRGRFLAASGRVTGQGVVQAPEGSAWRRIDRSGLRGPGRSSPHTGSRRSGICGGGRIGDCERGVDPSSVVGRWSSAKSVHMILRRLNALTSARSNSNHSPLALFFSNRLCQ